ncbi:MAG: hypothetical protein JW864_17425 [Spirochaetes bacterium]|nr:hypothetical protein [Spirochaetota bacterium]
MPPTKGDKEYEVRLGTPNSNIDKYRIGDPKYWPKNKEDKKKNAGNYIKNPEKKGLRGWFNFDPWQNPRDLKGCLGISKKDGSSFGSDFRYDTPNRKEKIFKALNNYLEEVIPDLKEVNRNDNGEKVSVIVEDLFKKEK